MKIRMIALAGVAALALTGSAVASDATGWYLGLGAGWDHMGNFTQHFSGPTTGTFKADTDDSALVIGAVGYRFTNHIRLEDEIGYDRHDVKDPLFTGHAAITSDIFNVNWDIPLSPRWDFTLGAGAGVGRGDLRTQFIGTPFDLMDGKRSGFMYQFMGGFAYSVSDNVDITLDYRYRSLSVNKSYPTSFIGYPVHAQVLH